MATSDDLKKMMQAQFSGRVPTAQDGSNFLMAAAPQPQAPVPPSVNPTIPNVTGADVSNIDWSNIQVPTQFGQGLPETVSPITNAGQAVGESLTALGRGAVDVVNEASPFGSVGAVNRANVGDSVQPDQPQSPLIQNAPVQGPASEFQSSLSPQTPSGVGGALTAGFNMAQDQFLPNNAPMGVDATQRRIADVFNLDAPATLNQSMTGNPNAVMDTDAQGRLRSFEAPEARQQNLADAAQDFEVAGDIRQAQATEDAAQMGQATRSDTGAVMSFNDARKQVSRRDGESVSSYNDRVNEFRNTPTESNKPLTESERIAREKFEYEKAVDAMEWGKIDESTRAKRADEMNTEIGALNTIVGQAENISGVTEAAQRGVGVNTTGFFSPLKWIGGTDAADLAGNLETIKSDAFVANITEMRNNSPTGGAVGNVSDKDLEMLQSLQTSFRQNLKPSTLRKNLEKYRELREKVANDAKAGFIRKYGQANFDKHFGEGSGASSSSSSIPNDRNVASPVDADIDKFNA